MKSESLARGEASSSAGPGHPLWRLFSLVFSIRWKILRVERIGGGDRFLRRVS